MIESIEKDLKDGFQKKNGIINNNGNYVMPKIFALNLEAQKREQQLNYLALNKKTQSAHFEEG